jgi:hypothetical protein
MKPTQEQVIAWAQEIATQCAKQGVSTWTFEYAITRIMELRTLDYEAGRKDENEACAELCEDLPAYDFVDRSDATIWDVATLECAAVIRARMEP